MGSLGIQPALLARSICYLLIDSQPGSQAGYQRVTRRPWSPAEQITLNRTSVIIDTLGLLQCIMTKWVNGLLGKHLCCINSFTMSTWQHSGQMNNSLSAEERLLQQMLSLV